MALAVNPRNIALLNRAPYLTLTEYTTAPEALDLSQLSAGQDASTNDDQLSQVLSRASSWIDTYCFPNDTGGVLAASLDVETGWTRVRRDGYAPLICRYKPVLELDSCAIGYQPSQTATLVDTGDVWFQSKIIWIPLWTWSAPFGDFGSVPPRPGGGRLFVQWSYVNGYPHAELAATATAGATTVVTTPMLGVYPGTVLKIYDGAASETVTVLTAATVAGETTLALAAPLQSPHTPPNGPDAISVSALPEAVRQAAIFLTSALIKTRGDNALVLNSLSAPTTKATGEDSGASSDVSTAKELLSPFRVVTPGMPT